MGNLHHRVLPILREIVTGTPELNIEQHGVCKGCMLGKHAKDTFLSSEHKSMRILDIVHSHVCGLTSITSITRSMYYVFFIEYFSQNMDLLLGDQ